MNPTPLILCANCRGPVLHKNEHAEPGEPWTCTTAPEVLAEWEARGYSATSLARRETLVDLKRDWADHVEALDRRAFLDALAARLEIGAREYGNASFDKPMAVTAGELEDEALDIAGWAYIMWVQLRRRCARLDGASSTLQSRPE